MEMTFTREEKQEILTFVRAVITAKFEDAKVKAPDDMDGKMTGEGSCFVTLHTSDGNLRGCIGNIIAYEPLRENIRHNAVNAAFHDPRFIPVGADELDGIEIEVSILTPARPIASPDDFIIGEHGIILQCRGRSAVFLPQVAPEQDWDREETLTHLCYKAGLPFKTWQADDAELSVFTAIVFSEKGTERNMLIKLNDLTIRAYLIPPQTTGIDYGLTPFIARHLQIKESDIIDYKILSKAVDSRRGAPALVYRLTANIRETESSMVCAGYRISEEELRKIQQSELTLPNAPAGLKNPLVIGSGPAGLTAALVLAQAGCAPIVLERGYDVEKRTADIDQFHKTRKFNPDSNYLLGEGGAGTFSDGKLYTRTNDPRAGFVLNAFVNAGAPPEILYVKRPHIGSDKLPNMVSGIRRQIEAAGGKFIFGARVKELIIEDNKCKGVVMHDGERIEAPAVIAAHGLGGRALTHKLIEHGVEFTLKGFQIGCRIEHPQTMIDENQYRMPTRPAWLGTAEYHLSIRQNDLGNIPGVSSFCMCPGGHIVPAGLEPGHLSTNGMSRYDRAGKFANACLIVSQPDDMFNNPHQAYKFLRNLENKAFELGGGDYTAPAQDARAFVKGKTALKNEETSYSFGLKSARIDRLLPPKTAEALIVALRKFDHSFHGFLKHGKIVGVETFVSSPIRFLRNSESLGTSVDKLYVAGEGAGYAGGILSAAVDGIKIAEKMLEDKY